LQQNFCHCQMMGGGQLNDISGVPQNLCGGTCLD